MTNNILEMTKGLIPNGFKSFHKYQANSRRYSMIIYFYSDRLIVSYTDDIRLIEIFYREVHIDAEISSFEVSEDCFGNNCEYMFDVNWRRNKEIIISGLLSRRDQLIEDYGGR